MTQPPNPGQPYIPPSSAQSAPGSYSPQQQYAQAGSQPQQGFNPPTAQYSQGGAPVVGAPHAGPTADSLLTNLFDATRSFAIKYGKIIMIVGAVGYTLTWLYGAYAMGDRFSGAGVGFAFDKFLINLIMNAPEACIKIFILRLAVEIAARLGGPRAQQH